ncbi:DUF6308 family protein [Geodermatophilus sp. SYSU D00705]
MHDGSAPLRLPSAGPDLLPAETAVAAVLGYARGRRPLWFRSIGRPEGRWVSVLAFGYERFDSRPRGSGPLGDDDVLTAEGLHGRLDPAGWAAVRTAMDDVAPLADAVTERAAGRPFWELPPDELSVLGEPGTVGAALRDIGERVAGPSRAHLGAALHHRRPELFPLVDATTRRQLLPHLEEGDSGVEAVVHRELVAGAEAFAVLESTVSELLGATGGVPLTRLRLHDVLVWLSGSLRLTHAVALGRETPEWAAYRG